MYYVIVNPASKTGKGRKVWRKAKRILKEEKVEFRIYHTSLTRNATDIARAILDNFSGEIKLLVLGGDGTVNETLQAFHEEDFERVTLAYLPTGSSNDLARDIGYDKSVEVNVRHLISSGAYKLMDVGLVTYNKTEIPGYTKRYFAVSCGMGYDASVCYEATTKSKLKNILNSFGLGKLSYGGICLKQLLGIERANITLTLDDREPITLEKSFFVVAMNHRYQGGGIMFCPDAVDNDGVLDICAANNISKPRVLTILPTCYSGKHVGKKGILIDRAKKLHIVSDIPLYVHTDGEVKTQATDICIECKHAKLKFVV